MDGLSHQRRSSCLLFQMFGVEIYSFLPDDQRDRGNLPGQGETSHRRLRPLGQQSLVESVERSSGDAGHGGCTLEDFLEIVVMILIQSTKLLRFPGTLQLPVHVAVLGAVVRLQSKTTVVPESVVKTHVRFDFLLI